jgi:hypothetical protein
MKQKDKLDKADVGIIITFVILGILCVGNIFVLTDYALGLFTNKYSSSDLYDYMIKQEKFTYRQTDCLDLCMQQNI